MQRVIHPVAGQDAGSRPEPAGEHQAPAASAAPSYVESVLFGRKRRLSPDATARAASEPERN